MSTEEESDVNPEEPKSEEDKAREAAEARRRRILEGANDRMGIVSGEKPKQTVAEEPEESGANPDAGDSTADNTAAVESTGDDADAGAGGTTTAPSKPSSRSGAARMAAMRKRRFKKKQQADAGAGGETSAESSDDKVEPATPSPQQVTTTQPEKESRSSAKPTTAAVSPEPEASVEAAASDSTAEAGATDKGEKKKYMGVAKMRRRMLKEKQQSESVTAKKNDEHDDSGDVIVDEKNNGSRKKKNPISRHGGKAKRIVLVLPIIMHVVTILLLFGAGLDIGLQQQKYYGSDSVLVHADLAPRQLALNLLEKLQDDGDDPSSSLLSFKSLNEGNAGETSSNLDKLKNDAAGLQSDDPQEDDEFGTDEEARTPNIDPLFKVDLDELTSGPGLYMSAARLAVRGHRLILAMVYYLPLRLVDSMVMTGQNLLASPPIPCLAALTLRHLVGKAILGASLPDKVVMDEVDNQKEVIGTMKNVVMSFVTKAFPTAFTLYDAFVHLRADMYVIMCGFFVGMAWNHSRNWLLPPETLPPLPEESDIDKVKELLEKTKPDLGAIEETKTDSGEKANGIKAPKDEF